MIQLALTDPAYRSALGDYLRNYASETVTCVQQPDSSVRGVLVVDPLHLGRVPRPVENPERIVLVAGNRSEDLRAAWEAGLQSVVLRDDPISTAVLAVLAARLQNARAKPKP